MKRLLTALLVPAMAVTCLAGKVYFTGVSDKNPMLYKTGEEMTFTIRLMEDGKALTGRQLKWTRKGDDGKKESGSAVSSEQPLVIKTKTDKPGFVRITVNLLNEKGKPVRNEKNRPVVFDGGAGANVNEIPATKEPADFDEFWAKQIKTVYAMTGKVTVTPVKSKDANITVFEFSLPMSKGEAPATGVIAMPKNAKDKSLPLDLRFFGYGYGATPVYYGQAKKAIVVAVTRMGESPLADKQFYKNLEKERKGFGFKNNEKPETSDFYQLLMRDLRAVRYAKTLPAWNGKVLTITGGSMGAFQTTAMAALTPETTKINIHIPWLADLEAGKVFKRMTGWRPDYKPGLGYFDTANFAKRIKCEAEMSIFLGDYVCPPSGEVILFNNLAGKKRLTVIQNGGHGSSYEQKPAKYIFKQAIK